MSEFAEPTHRPSKKTKSGESLTIADVLADKRLAQHSVAFRERIEREAQLRETSLNEAPVLPDQMGGVAEGNSPSKSDYVPDSVKESAPSDHVGVRIVNGEIVIDESTLTFHQADVGRLQNLQVEHEFGNSNNGRRKKTPRTTWSKLDIEEFYLNLQKYGTDFDLMSQVMSKFTRKQILNRFRLEEKSNSARIDYSLSHSLPFDQSDFGALSSDHDSDEE